MSTAIMSWDAHSSHGRNPGGCSSRARSPSQGCTCISEGLSITAGVLPTVTRGGPGCIYAPLPSRGWKRNWFAMGEPTFSWYDGCTFGLMKLGGDHASLKATGWNALLKMLSGAEPSPSQCLWGSWRKTGGTHGTLPPAIDIQPAGWGGSYSWSSLISYNVRREKKKIIKNWYPVRERMKDWWKIYLFMHPIYYHSTGLSSLYSKTEMSQERVMFSFFLLCSLHLSKCAQFMEDKVFYLYNNIIFIISTIIICIIIISFLKTSTIFCSHIYQPSDDRKPKHSSSKDKAHDMNAEALCLLSIYEYVVSGIWRIFWHAIHRKKPDAWETEVKKYIKRPDFRSRLVSECCSIYICLVIYLIAVTKIIIWNNYRRLNQILSCRYPRITSLWNSKSTPFTMTLILWWSG